MNTQFEIDIAVARTIPQEHTQPIQKLLLSRRGPTLCSASNRCESEHQRQKQRRQGDFFDESSLKLHNLNQKDGYGMAKIR